MIEQNLEKLGFSKNEIIVYLATFSKESLRAGEIIKETKLHRNLVYQALEKLVERGVVSKIIKDGVFVFEATNPSHLLEVIERKKMIAQDVIQELQNTQALSGRDIRIYDGLPGLVQARRQSLELRKGESVYTLGVSPIDAGSQFEREWQEYHKERIAKGIAFRALYAHSTESAHVLKRKSQPLTEARTLSSSLKSPIWFESYGDILTIGLPKSGPLVFSLKSREAAEGLRQYFDYLWNQEVGVESGVEAIGEAFYEMLGELEGGEEYCVIGASDMFQKIMPASFFETYHAARIKKSVHVRMLTHSDSLKNVRRSSVVAGDPKGVMSEFRSMKTGQSLPIQINLYRKKTILIVYGDNPCVMRFDRADVHDLFQNYFDELWNQETAVLTGKKGIEELCEMVLQAGNDLYLIGANGEIMNTHKDYYATFTKRRVEKKLFLHMLGTPDIRGTEFSRLPLSSVHYLPKGFESPMVVWIFGEYVAHVLWHAPQKVFLTHGYEIAHYYRNYFDGLSKFSSE